MPKIFVAPLSGIAEAIDAHGPSHLISLLDPHHMIETPKGIDPARHLKVGVNDIHEPRADAIAPGELHVKELLSFIDGWDHRDPLLIHCWAGISRSTASMFITLCHANPQASELEIARDLRVEAPHAQPNRLLVRHADKLLGRNGRMVEAVEAMSPARIVFEGHLFHMPSRRNTHTKKPAKG